MRHPAHTPHSPQEALLLESTLFAEETDLSTLQALLDQVEEDRAASWSPRQGWRQFQKAHRACFPSPLPRRAVLWAAALGAAACVGLPLLGEPAREAPASPGAQTVPVDGGTSPLVPLGNLPYQPAQVLPDLSWLQSPVLLAGSLPSLEDLVALTRPQLRAVLPPDAWLSQGPVTLPHDAQLDAGPWFLPAEDDAPLVLETEDGTELEIRNFVRLP